MLTDKIEKIEDVIDLVMDGIVDDDLDTLSEAIRERRSSMARKDFLTIKVGDKVKFTQGRPKYLIGLTAKVVGKKQTKLSIEFEDKVAARKFGYGPVSCPPSMVEKL